jgi:Holliday junction resolvase
MSKYQSKIIKQYKLDGWIVIKTIKLSDSGYPDLFIFKDSKAIFIEVKEKTDTLKEIQKYRIDQLIKQGFDAFCLQDTKGIIYPNEKTNQT